MNAQGEDVVAGVRTPETIDRAGRDYARPLTTQFKVVLANALEAHYRDMQDMEFTIEDKKLYMLQTRNGERTPQAALKIACDLVDEGMITPEKAVSMIEPRNLDALLHPQSDARASRRGSSDWVGHRKRSTGFCMW